jgi:hypothetical protein
MSADWNMINGQLDDIQDSTEYIFKESDYEYKILFNSGKNDEYGNPMLTCISNLFDIKDVNKRIKQYIKEGTIKDGKYIVVKQTTTVEQAIVASDGISLYNPISGASIKTTKKVIY